MVETFAEYILSEVRPVATHVVVHSLMIALQLVGVTDSALVVFGFDVKTISQRENTHSFI
jgi:hypothetical protein